MRRSETVEDPKCRRRAMLAGAPLPPRSQCGVPPILRSPEHLREGAAVRMDTDAEDEACLSGAVPAGGVGVGPSGPLDPGRRREPGRVAADAQELASPGRARPRRAR